MPGDLTRFLWALKLGAVVNGFYLIDAVQRAREGIDLRYAAPAAIFFLVSGWRCLLPNRYEENVVLHDTVLSSAFLTRVISTASEVAYIFLLAYALVAIDVGGHVLVSALAGFMVLAVVISQVFVWSAILTTRNWFFVFEESGWWLLFAAHTLACGVLLRASETPEAARGLLVFGVVFGFGYLPWQVMHLRALAREARNQAKDQGAGQPGSRSLAPLDVRGALHRALVERKVSTASADWGGVIGVTWMAAYWALLIPSWLHAVLRVASAL